MASRCNSSKPNQDHRLRQTMVASLPWKLLVLLRCIFHGMIIRGDEIHSQTIDSKQTSVAEAIVESRDDTNINSANRYVDDVYSDSFFDDDGFSNFFEINQYEGLGELSDEDWMWSIFFEGFARGLMGTK